MMEYTQNPDLAPKVVAIIQSRMGSKRLPGKSVKMLAGKPILQHVIERAAAITDVSQVVVATTVLPEDDEIERIAKESGADCYRGSESNVLERYYHAAKKHYADYVVRITGDNPFTDPEYGSMAVEIASASRADLSSIANIPLGTAVEIIRMKALEEAYKESSTNYHFEHVTPYIKEHPEFYTIQRHPIKIDNPFKKLRLTVDTSEDLEFASKIYDALYKPGEIFSIKDVIDFLKENEELLLINNAIVQREMTHSENE